MWCIFLAFSVWNEPKLSGLYIQNKEEANIWHLSAHVKFIILSVDCIYELSENAVIIGYSE